MAFVAGAVVAVAGGVLLYAIRPRDPVFEVMGVNLKGLKFRFCTDSPLLMAVIDTELVLSIKVTNPNVTPIEYNSSVMDIYYRDTLLGQAQVQDGSQGPNSTELIQVPAKLYGLELTAHVKDLIKDVMKREMCMRSVVTIKGSANIWKWKHPFEVHVESEIKVDPVFLDVIEQENKVHMQLNPLI